MRACVLFVCECVVVVYFAVVVACFVLVSGRTVCVRMLCLIGGKRVVHCFATQTTKKPKPNPLKQTHTHHTTPHHHRHRCTAPHPFNARTPSSYSAPSPSQRKHTRTHTSSSPRFLIRHSQQQPVIFQRYKLAVPCLEARFLFSISLTSSRRRHMTPSPLLYH